MRTFVSLVVTCWILSAQDAATPAGEPSALPVVTLNVAPLAPPDLDSPYASPRDAARHRFQGTLADLQSAHNIKAGRQGFAEAFALDRTYAAAACNLGINSLHCGEVGRRVVRLRRSFTPRRRARQNGSTTSRAPAPPPLSRCDARRQTAAKLR